MTNTRLELCNMIRMEAEHISDTGFPLDVFPQAVQSVILDMDRYENYKTEKSIDNGWDSCQKFCCHLQWFIDYFRTVECHEYCCQDSNRYTDDNCASRYIQTSNDHRKDSVYVILWFP